MWVIQQWVGNTAYLPPPDFTFVNKDGVVCRMFPDPPGEDEGWRTPDEYPSSPEAPFWTPENINRRVYRRLLRRESIKARKEELEELEQQLRREERVASFDATHSAQLESERKQRELERERVFAELAKLDIELDLIKTNETNELWAKPVLPEMKLPPAGPPPPGPSFHFVF